MHSLSVSRLAMLLFIFIFAASLLALDKMPPSYQKGTITISSDSPKSYDLTGSG